ncbi:type II toxin-antitoxin system death-on-curing family toxin [Salinigranum sp.]|uniref:type II toxin-antitoxin system death-on-curing family toxin n=1 Tax=Salinigranum sp. TaxID=1966351 RepID=UPI003568D60E
MLDIDEDIVSEYPDTSPGVQRRADIEFVLEYVSEGSFREAPETIHEKAFHLLRLLVTNHPFVDSNKRTALNTTVVFYLLNGYRFNCDNEIREILKQFGTDETAADADAVLEYLRTNTTDVDLNEVVAEWRDDLVEYGLDQLRQRDGPERLIRPVDNNHSWRRKSTLANALHSTT